MSLEELLSTKPFECRSTKNGLVHISYNGRVVTTLSGRESSRFLNKVESADEEQAQLAMAKATGHFKHGTERSGKERRGRKD